MFVLTLWVLDCPQPVVLRYSDGGRAAAALLVVRDRPSVGTLDVRDDFGVDASIPCARLLVPVLTDVAGAHRGNAAMAAFEVGCRAELPAGLVGP